MPGKGLGSVLTGGGADAVQPGGDPEICAVLGISSQSQRERRRQTDTVPGLPSPPPLRRYGAAGPGRAGMVFTGGALETPRPV